MMKKKKGLNEDTTLNEGPFLKEVMVTKILYNALYQALLSVHACMQARRFVWMSQYKVKYNETELSHRSARSLQKRTQRRHHLQFK